MSYSQLTVALDSPSRILKNISRMGLAKKVLRTELDNLTAITRIDRMRRKTNSSSFSNIGLQEKLVINNQSHIATNLRFIKYRNVSLFHWSREKIPSRSVFAGVVLNVRLDARGSLHGQFH